MKKIAKKRKIRNGRLIMVIVLFVALVTGVTYGLYKLFTNDPYAVFDVYQKDNKLAGSMKHYTKTEDDVYHASFYYPEFEDKDLNKTIEEFKNKNLTYKDTKEMYYTNIDYSSNEVFNQYISVAFHKTVKNKDEKILSESKYYINYDKKTKKLLSVKDVLRRDYLTMLKGMKSSVSPDSIKTKNLHDFMIKKDKVVFEIEGKKLSVNYKDYSKYIKLKNKNIPSLYQQDATEGKTQKVDPDKPMIAFTFDDGPNATYTASIMDEFEKYKGSATFFMLGQNASALPDLVKNVYKRGFELGNHSWDHSMRIAASKSNFMSKEEVIDEIYKTQDVIYTACGEEPVFFRPPYGALNQNVRDVSTLDFALWNVDTTDWKSRNTDAITNEIMKSSSNGSVILLHDLYGSSAEAIKKALPQLQAKGYQFVSLSTLMKYHRDTLTSENIVIPFEN